MNFFERQDAARRSSKLLVLVFVAAVVCIVLAINLALAAVWLYAAGTHEGAVRVPTGLFVVVTAGTVGVILAVSLFKMAALRVGGGAAVARMVGARRVEPNTKDPLERRLVNVVEEMAIAAGARVPAVYVMDDENGINAFAAGHDVSSSIVAVTRGTLESLTRDELQGVVGHEFSHIVNGDMALNIRMIGVLAGIVFLGAIGGFVMRNTEGKSKEAGALFFAGLALYVIGYIGLFFARLIKASVSRQREFLADASGVQFTRNPDGLAGALDQIRAGAGSLVVNRHAEDVSHLFFGQAIAVKLDGFFATHPPLDERIKRINPRFQSQSYRGQRAKAAIAAASAPPPEAMGFAEGTLDRPAAPDQRLADSGQRWGRSPKESAALVGSVDDKKMEVARRLLAAIPTSVREKMHEPEGAAATVVALLLAQNEAVKKTQLEAIANAGAGGIAAAADQVFAQIGSLGPAYYLPIVDLALPALKAAGDDLKLRVLTAVQAAIHADRRVSLFEFVVFTLLRWQFAPPAKPAPPKYRSLDEVKPEVIFLLSLMAYASGRRGPDAQAQTEADFASGAKEAGWQGVQMLTRNALGLDKAGEALAKLRDLAPMPKAVLVKSLFAVVTADGTIRVIEAALMRTVSAVLDCPLPPLLEETDPSSLAA